MTNKAGDVARRRVARLLPMALGGWPKKKWLEGEELKKKKQKKKLFFFLTVVLLLARFSVVAPRRRPTMRRNSNRQKRSYSNFFNYLPSSYHHLL